MIQKAVCGEMASVAESVSLADFDTVFIGTPNWSGTATPDVKGFLGSCDLSGKTVVPFCTHGMGGLQNIATDITALCPSSDVKACFAIKGAEADGAEGSVRAWLTEIGLL
jgi:flavodoxin